MKTLFKTLFKGVAILALLGASVVAAQAQTVIGSWLTAPIPPTNTPALYDEGWQRGQGGFGPNGSIFASSNYPTFFELKTNVATGYAQSLDIHETGFGNVRLFFQLSTAQIAAFTNNSKLNFTFSCDSSASSGSTAGFLQMVQFQCNSSGSGFQSPAVSTAGGFSETGDTNNNSGGQPKFFFFAGSPARSQVVTWDYSSLKPAINSSTFIQLVFIFQSGGGAPTNIYINNVTLSGSPVPSINVDQFNPTNNPYAGTNDYNAGYITNIYANWFGAAFSNAVWDSTMDAQSNANSGSLKITASFGTNGLGGQFTLMDKGPGFSYPGINPPITNGLGLLTFQCDVYYDPTSPVWVNGGVTNFGNLRFGVVPPFSPQDFFGAAQISVTNTGWVHLTFPLNAAIDPNLLSISGLIINEDGQSFGNLQGVTRLWVDNLKFTYTNITFIPPPVVTIDKPSPAMRLFAGSSGQFDRQEVATVDQNQSWIGGTYPVNYSFTVKNIPATIGQTHIFLIPAASIPGGNPPYYYNGVDFTASNGVWLTVGPSGIATLSWKTNLPSANAYQLGVVALTFTNPTAAGTWTLTFNSASTGSVTGPGGSPHAFTITDPNVSTDFANPVVAYFGLQGNNTPGTYEDWTAISVSGVSGANENENFAAETSRVLPAIWTNMCGSLADLVIVSTADMPAYWVSWTLPAFGYDIGSKTNLLGSDWIGPIYYSGYNDETAPYGTAQQMGPNMWVLLPSDDLPTVTGLPSGAIAPVSFFTVVTNVVFP